MRLKRDIAEMQMLGPGVLKHLDIQAPKPYPTFTEVHGSGSKCVDSTYGRCDRSSILQNRHGWLCKGHLAALNPKREVEAQPPMPVILPDPIIDDVVLASDWRLSDHYHLMRATIYRADGTPKFQR